MEGRERSQSKTEPSTASTVSPSQSRESRFSRSFGGVGGAGSATVAGDAWPASKVDSGEAPREEIAVKAEGDRRPSNVASDSRVSVDGSDGNATDRVLKVPIPARRTRRPQCGLERRRRVGGQNLHVWRRQLMVRRDQRRKCGHCITIAVPGVYDALPARGRGVNASLRPRRVVFAD